MNKVCKHCDSTEVVVHDDVEMATCRECGFAGSVLCFDGMNIAYWLAHDIHALAELFVVRQFNSLYGVVEGVELISWYSILAPDKTFNTRNDALMQSISVLRRESSRQCFYKFMKEMRKYNAPAESKVEELKNNTPGTDDRDVKPGQNDTVEDVLRVVESVIIDVLDAALMYGKDIGSGELYLRPKLDQIRGEAKSKLKSILREEYDTK